jgi:hypothetical protein
VLLNDNLKEVWGGSRMIGEKRITCEESQAEGEEEEQTESTATLSPCLLVHLAQRHVTLVLARVNARSETQNTPAHGAYAS